jgi:hypothetical protein
MRTETQSQQPTDSQASTSSSTSGMGSGMPSSLPAPMSQRTNEMNEEETTVCSLYSTLPFNDLDFTSAQSYDDRDDNNTPTPSTSTHTRTRPAPPIFTPASTDIDIDVEQDYESSRRSPSPTPTELQECSEYDDQNDRLTRILTAAGGIRHPPIKVRDFAYAYPPPRITTQTTIIHLPPPPHAYPQQEADDDVDAGTGSENGVDTRKGRAKGRTLVKPAPEIYDNRIYMAEYEHRMMLRLLEPKQYLFEPGPSSLPPSQMQPPTPTPSQQSPPQSQSQPRTISPSPSEREFEVLAYTTTRGPADALSIGIPGKILYRLCLHGWLDEVDMNDWTESDWNELEMFVESLGDDLDETGVIRDKDSEGNERVRLSGVHPARLMKVGSNSPWPSDKPYFEKKLKETPPREKRREWYERFKKHIAEKVYFQVFCMRHRGSVVAESGFRTWVESGSVPVGDNDHERRGEEQYEEDVQMEMDDDDYQETEVDEEERQDDLDMDIVDDADDEESDVVLTNTVLGKRRASEREESSDNLTSTSNSHNAAFSSSQPFASAAASTSPSPTKRRRTSPSPKRIDHPLTLDRIPKQYPAQPQLNRPYALTLSENIQSYSFPIARRVRDEEEKNLVRATKRTESELGMKGVVSGGPGRRQLGETVVGCGRWEFNVRDGALVGVTDEQGSTIRVEDGVVVPGPGPGEMEERVMVACPLTTAISLDMQARRAKKRRVEEEVKQLIIMKKLTMRAVAKAKARKQAKTKAQAIGLASTSTAAASTSGPGSSVAEAIVIDEDEDEGQGAAVIDTPPASPSYQREDTPPVEEEEERPFGALVPFPGSQSQSQEFSQSRSQSQSQSRGLGRGGLFRTETFARLL